ncbi:hypothetical protein [Dokdonia sp.]|uniref:hypothetical protein n=1 Tax=Dokdonia sp. TaxID=2024995 RepID=UPI003265CDB6
MNLIDQNSAIVSLNKALVPSPYLIESRSESDRLSFLTNFASLINFYDNKNKINGNWSPFLLKDPVFLMASISKTPFQKIHTMYVKSCIRVRRKYPPSDTKDTTFTTLEIINILFDQLIEVFHIIERWTYFLYKSDEVYVLKNYVITEIKKVYGELLWAILSLRAYLSQIHKQIDDVNWYSFESFDKKIWKETNDTRPFWDVLGLNPLLNENTVYDYYIAVKSAGDMLFSFFNSIIEYSNVEYKNVKKIKGKFPDTLLLRTFTNLLQIYENQLNTLSSKHLQFYYKDILKQNQEHAKADSVYICADLVEIDKEYDLPKNTLFIAGTYEDTSPILFGSEKQVSLNPATVQVIYTLYKIEDTLDKKFSDLYLAKQSEVDVVKKDEEGVIESWKTFGTSIPSPDQKVSIGFCFASPMLFLREGKRTITIVFTLKNEVKETKMFTDAAFYLSTQTDWLEILTKPNDPIIVGEETPSKEENLITIDGRKVTVLIELKEEDPSIEAFLENPDGIESVWPMFRISFPKLETGQKPPEIDSLDIDVDVKGVRNFQLYNDFGVLETKKPFQPLGLSPAKDQSFIIGSNEVFTKKVDTLDIQLNWDNLPPLPPDTPLDEFSTYYNAYNKFLYQCYSDIQKDCSQKPPDTSDVSDTSSFKVIGTFLEKMRSLVKNNPDDNSDDNSVPKIFNNTCFHIDFQLLQYGEWVPIIVNASSVDISKPQEQTLDSDENSEVTIVAEPLSLFQNKASKTVIEDTDESPKTDTSLKTYSSYTSSSIADFQNEKNPIAQLETIPYSDSSTSGFLRMQLTAPSYGFGMSLYPKVVSAIALYNAQQIIKYINDPENATLENVPNEPYSPTASLFIGNYTSSVSYSFSTEKNEYPLECFYYSPFCNFKVYDTEDGYIGQEHPDEKALPMFQYLPYDGQLLITLTDIITPAEVSFFFELANTNTTEQVATVEIEYKYLSTSGWKPLDVLSDETNGFSCSGIITFNIQDDISNDTHTMPGLGVLYYLSIGVKGNLDAFPETVFLKTNGIKLQRVDQEFSALDTKPFIQPDTILTTLNGIPAIAAIAQPFSSFGGVASETNTQMDRRISKRIKTKDRLVTSTDYFRAIQQNFTSIYYVKPVYSKKNACVEIYVINKVANWMNAHAFRPYVTSCKRLEIQEYLKNKTSVFTKKKVRNFEIVYIRVLADVSVEKGNEPLGIGRKINTMINIFLAPWIQSNQEQISISSYLDTAQIASFIKSQKGVLNVENVEIQKSLDISDPKKTIYSNAEKQLTLSNDNQLFVPSLDSKRITYS